jgi:hypothetical protein
MITHWRKQLRFDALSALLSAPEEATVYFTKRDLLHEPVAPISQVWDLPGPQNIVRRQQPGGSWGRPVRKNEDYADKIFNLVETFKQFRVLVEHYEFTRDHPSIPKAAEFLLSFQTPAGDIRGFIANQYATYYTGSALALLNSAGYEDDARVEKGMRWLLAMRQDDGGWTIPILTHKFERETAHRLTSRYAEPVEPDRSRPFSHNWTDMVLRAFAAHPAYRKSDEARAAGALLKSSFFQPDAYSSYHAASYWTRFAFWWPNLLTALDSLSLLGFPANDPDISKGLQWFIDNQEPDGLWRLDYSRESPADGKSAAARCWLGLAIYRMLQRYYR